MEIRESGLMLPIRGLPTAIEGLRLRYDPSVELNIEPHVTITTPFLPREEINSKTHALLRQVVRGVEPFTTVLSEARRFPSVVYLAPEDETPYHALLDAVLTLWPGYPPYEGRFTEYLPHVTIANEVGGSDQAEIIERLEEMLPVEIFCNELLLVERDGLDWRRTPFALGAPKRRR